MQVVPLRRALTLGALAASMALGTVTRPARADDKAACLAAYDQAQKLRSSGKLGEAREQLASCSRNECPPLVRQDCAQWTAEVLAALPSVVFGARDAQGHDLIAVRVSVDGVVVARRLDGKPISLDPGAHEFTFESEGASVKQSVLIREGEKNRAITVTFGASEHPPGEGGRGAPAGAYVLGAVGVVALGAAVLFDLQGTNDAHHLRDTCAPSCNQSDVDAVKTKYLVAGIALGVGVVAFVGAAYLLLSRGGSTDTPTQGKLLRIDVAPVPGGGAFVLGSKF